MNNKIITLIACLCACCGSLFSQQRDTAGHREEMPKLEIPEITIVGKKAITLPFARKGEIYDVELYDAPPPEAGLLGQPPSMSLLRGSLPRYRQEEMPWRFSAEGILGSFSTLGGVGYAHYISQRWGADGSFGFKRTNGHTTNADASSFAIGGDLFSLIRTDNVGLKTFRATLGTSFEHNNYGLFGIQTSTVRRRVNEFDLNAGLSSVNRQGTVIDVDLGAKFGSLNDSNSGLDSSVSTVSPDLRAMFSTDIKTVKIITGISYRSTSLDYSYSTQSPSLVDLSLSARWNAAPAWIIEAGGKFARGEDNLGGERTLVTPFGSGRLTLDSTFSISVWFKPEMLFTSYDDYLKKIPYLVREFTVAPERQPVALGSSFFYNNGPLSLEVRGSFTQFTNAAVAIADSGRIYLEYLDATKTSFDVEGALQLTNISRILFSGSVVGAYEKDSSSQLPMVPAVHLTGKWETDFRIPVKAWSSVEYLSKRNIDRAGTQSLGNVFLVNAGASTSVIPKIVIAGEIQNLFDVGYEWWNGYPAPGIQFNVTAKFNLQ